jgi:uncharacterized protein with ParB-like and HNH nuclease domain
MNLESLKSLFKDRIYRIPDYQRGYAWEHDQLVDFWDDLINLKNDRSHYTGLLALREINNNEVSYHKNIDWLLEIGYKAFHVIDGQQRLTTALILVNEIAEFVSSLDENEGKAISEIHIGYESIADIKSNYIVRKKPPKYFIDTFLFGYENDNPSSQYLEHEIFGKPGGGTLLETYYTKKMMFAKKYFMSKLKDYYQNNGLLGIESIYKKLTHKFMFNLYIIDKMDEAYVIFETMNNRGKKLSNLELLKNRMIFLTTLYREELLESGDREKLRSNINDAWKEVYHQLGRNKNNPLSDDEFLRAHWIAFYQYTRRTGDDYIKFLLEKFNSSKVSDKSNSFELKEDEEEIFEKSKDFGSEGLSFIEKVDESFTDRLQPEEINEYVNSIKELAEFWYYSFYPYECPYINSSEKLHIERLNRIGIGYFRPLLMVLIYTSKTTNDSDRIQLLSEIERFIFLLFRLGGFNATYKINEFYSHTRHLYQGKDTIAEITSKLIGIIENDISTAISYFSNRVKRWYEQGDGYYGWYGLKYFLFEYEYMLSEISKIDKVDWSLVSKQEKDKVTIEHILPQTPSKFYWQNQFRHYSEKEVKTLSSSLGNLILLSQSMNSSLQNDSFENKKYSKHPNRRGYFNGSNSEIEVSQEKDWNAQIIKLKGLKYLEFMEKRWKIQLTEQQKSDLLQLNFVSNERETLPELIEIVDTSDSIEEDDNTFYDTRLSFWQGFVEWGQNRNRLDIVSRKPSTDNWYDVNVNSSDYHIFFQLLKSGHIRIGIYVYSLEGFERLISRKDEIEKDYGSNLEWYTSRDKSYAKRILHSIERDIFDSTMYSSYYDWFIEQHDKLIFALNRSGSSF